MKFEIDYLGFEANAAWPAHRWTVKINGASFEYRTGAGHATPFFRDTFPGARRNARPTDRPVIADADRQAWVDVPKADDVLACLLDDARAGSESFDDFASNYGVSSDSLKALDTYRACMDTAARLRKALGPEYGAETQRIDALRESGAL